MNSALPLIWRRFPERYTLRGNKCESCGQSFFPPRAVCPKCRRKGKLVEGEMPREGKIISWTEVHAAPMGFENETPYVIAIIELNNKARLLTQVVDSALDTVKIGAKVKKCFRKIADTDSEGPIAYGYKFKVME